MLTRFLSGSIRVRLPMLAAFACLLHTGVCTADDLLGLYVGGTVGQSRIQTDWTLPALPITVAQTPAQGTFDQTSVGFKILAGIRPIPLVGAEVALNDLGHAKGDYPYSDSLGPARVSMQGVSAFGVLYLPVPAPVDLFVKAGVATIRSRLTTYEPVQGPCGLCFEAGPRSELVRTDSGFAAGAGVQWQIRQFAVRLEYEQFTAEGTHPALISFGGIWKL